LYANRQAEGCRALGIEYNLLALPDDISNRDLRHEVRKLSKDPAVTGIMLHMPLPHHIDVARVQFEIDVVKDVEGVNPANIGYVVYKHTLIAPCTALAAVELVKSTGVALRGAEAVVVGASVIVGKPVSLLLAEQESTVTLCHIATRDLAMHTRRADVLVVAVGKPGLITADLVKEGAVVVDVGINRITLPDGTKKTTGDVDFEGVKEKAGWITPVPGGVGPVTVAMLMRNTIRSAELLK
jgi:methylenetetrahydrofolate dehydrogenase (NADP+)/methenyltetrahydrofolate cyclohydrolase